MRRSSNPRRVTLGTLIGAGIAATLTSSTGVFAPFLDTAKTGHVSVTSAAEPEGVDLKLAMPAQGASCETVPASAYTDDLQTPLMTVENMRLTGQSTVVDRSVCLRNEGNQRSFTQARAVDVVDIDRGCTGDEATVDPTCAANPDEGELSSVVLLFLGDTASSSLSSTHNTGPLEPGGTREVAVFLGNDPDAAMELKRAAQSDQVTFRIAFQGTTQAA